MNNCKEQPRCASGKCDDAPRAAQNLPGKPDFIFISAFSTCRDAQMLLVTPEQQIFLQEHDVLKVMVCFYEARRETFRP